MLIPTIIADGFFTDPDEIVAFSKTLEFKSAPDGRWPGTRSSFLHEIDKVFFDKINRKILSLIFPGQINLQYNCSSSYQKIKQDIKAELKEGWVHYDSPHMFTAIIYLSKQEDVGTTIVDPKHFTSTVVNVDIKDKFNLGIKVPNFKYKQNENNKQFKEAIKVNSKYNRILIFDSSQYHYVPNMISKDTTEDRLTIVCFFNSVSTETGIQFPIPEMRKNKEF
tara:strand:- start:135 stop:800 length:666 start_codon:yes stop_codon:yes gene_type:complete